MQSFAQDKFDRTIIIGNTASGKSWLSKRLGKKFSSNVVDLDQIHWIDGDYCRKENTQVAIAKTIELSEQKQWIIEGIYGWLITPVIDRATSLIWIDIPWSEIRVNLVKREMKRGSTSSFNSLEAWAENYWQRKTSSSYEAHLSIFEDFQGSKFRFINMGQTASFIDGLEQVSGP